MTNLKCTCCDNIIQIPRGVGEKRNKGHVKHLWCYKCKEETAHRDFINDYDVTGVYSLSKEEMEQFEPIC